MKTLFRRRIHSLLVMVCVLGTLGIPGSTQASSLAAQVQSLSVAQDLHKPEPASGTVGGQGYADNGNNQPDKPLPSPRDLLYPSSVITAYAIINDSLGQYAKFVIFDLSHPSSGFGTINGNTDQYIWAAAFLRGEPSHMYALDSLRNKLITLDTTTGALTTIGASVPITGEAWSGLSASVDGTGLYASSTALGCQGDPGNHPSSLYTLDPNSGTATRIGPVSNTRCLSSIAVSPRTDIIFGVDVGLDVGSRVDENHLVAIDPRNGNATDTGVLDYSTDLPAMAFERQSGVLYLASHRESDGWRLTALGNIYSGSPNMIDVGTLSNVLTAMAIPIGDENWGGPPDKIAPTNGITDVVTNPTLSWQASGVSNSYDYCITTAVTLNGTVCSGGWHSVVSTSVSLSGLTSGQTYYWQVRATQGLSTTYGDDGNWWSFTTRPSGVLVTPNDGGSLTQAYPDGGTISLQAPPGAVVTDTYLALTITTSVSDTPAPNFMFAGQAFTLEAYQGGTRLPLTFATPITVVIEYTDANVADLDEGALQVYYRKGTGWAIDGITIVQRDVAHNRLVITIAHLSDFALFGPGTTGNSKVYLPFIRR